MIKENILYMAKMHGRPDITKRIMESGVTVEDVKYYIANGGNRGLARRWAWAHDPENEIERTLKNDNS